MDRDDAELLLQTAGLDRISGPLCDDVLGRPGSGVTLDRLERDNLFLIPLDEDRTWFRFHHLLADLLRAELSRRQARRGGGPVRRAAVVARGQRDGRSRPRVRDGGRR